MEILVIVLSVLSFITMVALYAVQREYKNRSGGYKRALKDITSAYNEEAGLNRKITSKLNKLYKDKNQMQVELKDMSSLNAKLRKELMQMKKEVKLTQESREATFKTLIDLKHKNINLKNCIRRVEKEWSDYRFKMIQLNDSGKDNG